jgi:hypothetical protein
MSAPLTLVIVSLAGVAADDQPVITGLVRAVVLSAGFSAESVE